MRVGITGQSGFIGTHLYHTLGLFPDRFERIEFRDEWFNDPLRLTAFVAQCDAVVHLAAMNRHPDPKVIYATNLQLVEQLITACRSAGAAPHILFSSSTQEERDNLYGRSKREGRSLLEAWAQRVGARFTGLVIPNVYGPFGQPYYNSVVATFCHQLTHGETPGVDVDAELQLIYVGELVGIIIEKIAGTRMERIATDKTHENQFSPAPPCTIQPTSTIRVSALLNQLQRYKTDYFEKGIIPSLDGTFDRNLFNTFLCYIEHNSYFPRLLPMQSDHRGSFSELVRMGSGGQVSFSTTQPGITRGNHFHTRKAERFAVIKGKARIDIRRIGTDKVYSFDLDGSQPAYVDMPIWHTHNITNVGDDELYTLFWINEQFNPEDPDTYAEIVSN